MKIKSLSLRNIASIEKADIDFEKDIIDEVTGDPASIFLISGDTGAGKSVILDGISMALYKKTPRTVGVVNKTRNEYTDNEGQSISINSIEQYTRLGISEKDECYSELVFEGNDGKIYRARLELGIMKCNADENGHRALKHRSPKWKVKVGDEDWQKVEAKTGQPILGAVGLTFEQFGRMAMLAQGQFASFLTGDKTERESILEQLTNTAKFSTYGKVISDLFTKAKSDRDNAKTAFDTEQAHTLEPEKLNELKNRYDELKTEKGRLDVEYKKTSDVLGIVNEIDRNSKDRQRAEEQKLLLENTVRGEEYIAKKVLIDDWDATNNERQHFAAKASAIANKENAEKQLDESKTNFGVLCADLAFRENMIKNKVTETTALESWINERKDLDEVYAKAESIVLQLRQYKEIGRKMSETEAALTAEKEKTAGLRESANELSKKIAEVKAEVDKRQNAIDTLTSERNKLNPVEINHSINSLSSKKADLGKLQLRINRLEKQREMVVASKLDIDNEQAKLAELKSAYESAQANYETMTRKEEDIRSLLTTMQMSVEETLTELRRRLQKTNADVCPLCGQHIDHLHLDDDFAHVLTPLQQREQEAKAQLKTATAMRDEAKSRYDILKGSLNNKTKAYDKAVKEADNEYKAVTGEARRLGLDATLDLVQQITDVIVNTDKAIAVLEEKQGKAETLQNDINRQVQDKKPFDEALSLAEKKLLNVNNGLQQNERDIKKYTQDASGFMKTKSELTDTLSAMLSSAYPVWASDADAMGRQLQNDAEAYRKKKSLAEKNRADIEKAELLLNTIASVRDGIVANHADWSKEAEPKAYPTRNINGEWTNLHSAISRQEHEIDVATKAIANATTALNSYYESSGKTESMLIAIIKAETQVAAARKFISDTDAALKSRKDAIEGYAKNIGTLLKKLEVGNIEDIPHKETLENTLAELNQRLEQNIKETGVITSQLKQNDANRERLRLAAEALDKAEAVFGKWNRMNSIFGGTRFRTLVQTYILRPLLNNANIYLEKITDRYILTCSEDNDQLAILVLDRYNKNQVRSVTVLSGGERFMISLALSLALSSLNRQDMNVNILFIDEGFGTLDETNLNSVMTTLEKLQEIAGQTNRRVGIISHREELIERIPVKIQVKKKGEGRSRVEILHE